MELFPGEEMLFTNLARRGDALTNDERINRKYSQGEVRIVTEQARYPLSSIVGMVESDSYELNPEFQRRHRWDVAKRSRLIESFIMNVPIPPIFLYEDTYGHFEVMDGLQRLTAIAEFYRDKFALADLVEWGELNGRRYSELPEQIKRGIDRRYLSSIILLQETAKDQAEAQRLKQLVFERINSGGITLEPQEARNAIYNGRLNQLCIRLARNPYLCRMWGIPEPSAEELAGGDVAAEVLANELYRTMADVEHVLRFFAYRQRQHNQHGALREYLDAFLKHGNLFPDRVLSEFSSLFTTTVQLVHDTLGEGAFWLLRRRNDRWSWLRRPTVVLYDPIMFVFSQHREFSGALIERRVNFRVGIAAFYKDNYDAFEGRYTNRSHTLERNRLFTEFIDGVLSQEPMAETDEGVGDVVDEELGNA